MTSISSEMNVNAQNGNVQSGNMTKENTRDNACKVINAYLKLFYPYCVTNKSYALPFTILNIIINNPDVSVADFFAEGHKHMCHINNRIPMMSEAKGILKVLQKDFACTDTIGTFVSKYKGLSLKATQQLITVVENHFRLNTMVNNITKLAQITGNREWVDQKPTAPNNLKLLSQRAYYKRVSDKENMKKNKKFKPTSDEPTPDEKPPTPYTPCDPEKDDRFMTNVIDFSEDDYVTMALANITNAAEGENKDVSIEEQQEPVDEDDEENREDYASSKDSDDDESDSNSDFNSDDDEKSNVDSDCASDIPDDDEEYEYGDE